MDESLVHHRTLYEHLGVWYFAQGYLGSVLKVFWRLPLPPEHRPCFTCWGSNQDPSASQPNSQQNELPTPPLYRNAHLKPPYILMNFVHLGNYFFLATMWRDCIDFIKIVGEQLSIAVVNMPLIKSSGDLDRINYGNCHDKFIQFLTSCPFLFLSPDCHRLHLPMSN